MFALQKTSLRIHKDKLQNGSKYLQTTFSTKDYYLDYIKNSQNSTIKNTNTWRLNNTLLNNQEITEEI